MSDIQTTSFEQKLKSKIKENTDNQETAITQQELTINQDKPIEPNDDNQNKNIDDNESKNETIIDDLNNKYKIIKNYKNMQGIIVIKTPVYKDLRGSFQETYNDIIQKYLPKTFKPIQDNLSKSMPNTFRGMHYDITPCNKSKYVSCPFGKVLDIFIDLRKDKPTYNKIGVIMLDNETSVFVPDGFAHGFLALDRSTTANVVIYKVDNTFQPEYSKTLNHTLLFYRNALNKQDYNLTTIDQETDSLLKIHFDSLFTSKKLILSEKDQTAPITL